MARILLISGSPKAEGNTAQLMGECAKVIREKGVEAEIAAARKAPGKLSFGAPGVGKGTQAEMLHDFFGACQLSTGDVFRDAKNSCAENLYATSRAALEPLVKPLPPAPAEGEG